MFLPHSTTAITTATARAAGLSCYQHTNQSWLTEHWAGQGQGQTEHPPTNSPTASTPNSALLHFVTLLGANARPPLVSPQPKSQRNKKIRDKRASESCICPWRASRECRRDTSVFLFYWSPRDWTSAPLANASGLAPSSKLHRPTAMSATRGLSRDNIRADRMDRIMA